MAKFSCSVAGGLHSLYGSTLNGIEAWGTINDHRTAAQALAHKGDFQARALLNGLVGAAAGGTVTLTYAEIEPNVEMGGKRNIINSAIINRVTTAQDVSDIKSEIGALSANTYTTNPVANGDRNPLGTR